MERTTRRLLKAFQEDHAVLGRGFHLISTSLRAGDLGMARSAASEMDKKAGAHIAFETEHFYPALVPLLGERRVEEMLAEHLEGLKVILALEAQTAGTPLPEERQKDLLRASEAMEQHIAECGELFHAMERIPESEQALLLEALLRLRAEQPSWSRPSNSDP